MKQIDLKKEQRKTPYLDQYEKYLKGNYSVFDVPGHHQGKIKTVFNSVFGDSIYNTDINCPENMDNLMYPHECIKEAQILAAKAYNADYVKFLVNGSSSGILIMFLSILNPKDKIILPRNIHKSVVNGLLLSGGIPIFVKTKFNVDGEFSTQPSLEEYKKTIDENKDAKAIFIINPTYYGVTLNIKELVDYAHRYNMIVLVDEAHGSHFYFNESLPMSAMEANADLSTLSTHKTSASLTQSSMLLIKGDRVNIKDINFAFNMLTTTSPSNILLASLDASRKFMVFHGEKYIDRAIKLCLKAKNEINKINGFKVLDKEYFLNNREYNFDTTKLVVSISDLSINGFNVYKILQSEYHIQIELAEDRAFLCLFTIGSIKSDVDRLVKALKEISKKYYKKREIETKKINISFPNLKLIPRDAYEAKEKKCSLKEAEGKISKEMIMIYPPGIPLIIPGEVFTKEVINQLLYYKKKGVNIISEYSKCDYVSCVDEGK